MILFIAAGFQNSYAGDSYPDIPAHIDDSEDLRLDIAFTVTSYHFGEDLQERYDMIGGALGIDFNISNTYGFLRYGGGIGLFGTLGSQSETEEEEDDYDYDDNIAFLWTGYDLQAEIGPSINLYDTIMIDIMLGGQWVGIDRSREECETCPDNDFSLPAQGYVKYRIGHSPSGSLLEVTRSLAENPNRRYNRVGISWVYRYR